MAWNGLVLTVDGQNALNAAQLANSMNIKSVVVGDGQPPDNFRTQKGLVHQLYEITDLKVDVEGKGRCTVTVDIPKVGYDYYFREIGIIVMTDEGEKLYVYDNCTDDAQYIVSTTGAETTRKRIRLTLNISDVAEITVVDSGIMYVSYDVFEETKAQMEEGIKNNAENLDGHVKDTGNPHKVSREHLNIEKIDNTADMDKPVSTAQQAALDALYEQLAAYTRQQIANLINGAPSSLDTLKEVADAISAHKTIMDALDAAIGKKASAAEFDSHVKDMTKHVTAAERTGWNGKLAPTGDASNVTATFSQATTRANLSSKEKLSVSLGKIMKWLADLANGAASTLLGTNLTASRALVANGNGKVAVSSVTATELGYLAGVTSGIQEQLNELNTGIPTGTFDNTWIICYNIYGWDMFAQLPLVSTAQKLTVTSAQIFLDGTWRTLAIKRQAFAYGGYLRIEFQSSGLAFGLYLCRITGKLEK